MEEKSELSVVIDGKVYRLSGGSDIYLQKLASYVDCLLYTSDAADEL